MMRIFTVVGLLVLLADAAVVRQDFRNHGTSGTSEIKLPGYHPDMFNMDKVMRSIESSNQPAAKPYKLESIPPLFNPQAKRIKLIYGPFKVKGSEVCILTC
jgi:hypothetical protein